MSKFDKVMINTALIWAEMSYCKRLKVGAVLSSFDGRILATGYNGTISGYYNICEEFESEDKKFIDNQKVIPCPECKGKGFNYKGFKPYEFEEPCESCQGKGGLRLKDKTSNYTLHAEQNIIAYCARNGIAMKDTILYVTHSPCKQCAKLIIQSGIKRVVYLGEYRDNKAISFLRNNGIEIEQYKEN